MKQLSSLHKISVSVIFLFLFSTAYGGDTYRLSAGAGEAGMGNVCIMKNGFWSSFQNQALLAFNNSISFGLSYENRFSIEELGTRSIGLAIPVGKASIGAVYSHFGYIDFKRDMTGLACGLKLSENISAGVQVDYFSERTTSEYNNNQSVTFETGLLFTPSENTRIGIHLFNPLPNSIRKNFLPTSIRVGVGTELSEILFAGVEAEMSAGNKLIVSTGYEYEAAKNLWLRGGFSTNNNSFSFGLGYLTKIAQLDLAFQTHEKLGVTSSVSLIFKIH
ncbi:MAG TPA: hypothetical protein VIK07_04605 [Bacteroidales bacterium]